MSTSYQGLARKWRPKNFAEMVGQEEVARSLANALSSARVAHGHLLAGPRGVGKTTSARIVARALNCVEGPTATPCGKCEHCVAIAAGNDIDVLEIDAASNTGIEVMKELLETAVRAPYAARFKVYILDEVHMLSNSSFNALLKTLEEPPPNVVFIFATTELDKVPETVRSRCVIHTFRRLTREDIARRLGEVARGEGLELDPEAAREIFDMIARSAEGGMRDALVTFDQLIALTAGTLDPESAERLLGLTSQATLAQTVDALADADAPRLLALVDDLVSRGRSLERYVKGLLAYMHDVMLLQAGAPASALSVAGEESLDRLGALARKLPRVAVFNMLNQLFQLEERMKRSTEVRYLIEFTFLRMAVVKTVVPVDDVIRRLQALPDREIGEPARPTVAEAAPAPAPEPERPALRSTREEPAPEAAPARRSPATRAYAMSDSEPSAPDGSSPTATLARESEILPEVARPALAEARSPADPSDSRVPSPTDAPAPPTANPLAGLSRDELVEAIQTELPESLRFVARYLRTAEAMRADGGALWAQWTGGGRNARRALEDVAARKGIESALERLSGRAMTLRLDFDAPALAPADASSPSPRPRPVPAAFEDSDPATEDDGYEPIPLSVLREAEEARENLGGGAPRVRGESDAPDASPDRDTIVRLLSADTEFARRARMVRDFFNGTFVDSSGAPVGV